MSVASRLVRPDVCWIEPPLWPCEILPEGRAGRVLLGDLEYAVLPVDDAHGHTFAFLVWRPGQEEPYQVETTTWTCDCPHAVYRGQGSCKHATTIRTAFEGSVP